ncbi:SlyX family protein [Oleiagrimonas sp. C23AA]|uniref:SlyX family protein n=1 Tax=Oleiagrimonas sp. C23AA TaxID=2719047 RepID=UPI001421D83C|nr:SlyX family protein [Oleiagrimonas sp. C23AA]NII10382.1 SlyX family protein [Oleiagrimonas sp. C23AA]
MPEHASDKARLDDLEVRLTFVDDTVSALSSADADMARRLHALEQAIRELRSEVTALRAASSHDMHSEPPPPHY